MAVSMQKRWENLETTFDKFHAKLKELNRIEVDMTIQFLILKDEWLWEQNNQSRMNNDFPMQSARDCNDNIKMNYDDSSYSEESSIGTKTNDNVNQSYLENVLEAMDTEQTPGINRGTIKDHSNEMENSCQRCSYYVANKSLMERHRKRCGRYPCHMCGMSFTKMRSFKRHCKICSIYNNTIQSNANVSTYNSHSKESLSFFNQSSIDKKNETSIDEINLNTRNDMHNVASKENSVKFKCPKCGIYFPQTLLLFRHSLRCSKFCCDLCDANFSYSNGLIRHKQTHSNQIKNGNV